MHLFPRKKYFAAISIAILLEDNILNGYFVSSFQSYLSAKGSFLSGNMALKGSNRPISVTVQ